MWLAGPYALWLISVFNSCITKYLYLSAKELKISAQKLSYEKMVIDYILFQQLPTYGME
jgi:hypothetical protein